MVGGFMAMNPMGPSKKQKNKDSMLQHYAL